MPAFVLRSAMAKSLQVEVFGDDQPPSQAPILSVTDFPGLTAWEDVARIRVYVKECGEVVFKGIDLTGRVVFTQWGTRVSAE